MQIPMHEADPLAVRHSSSFGINGESEWIRALRLPEDGIDWIACSENVGRHRTVVTVQSNWLETDNRMIAVFRLLSYKLFIALIHLDGRLLIILATVHIPLFFGKNALYAAW